MLYHENKDILAIDEETGMCDNLNIRRGRRFGEKDTTIL